MAALTKGQRRRIKKFRSINKDPNQQLDAKQQQTYDKLKTIRNTNKADAVNNPGSVYNADVGAEVAESGQQIKYQNPDVIGPTGSTTTTIDPVTGKPTVNQTLSGNQGDILSAGEGLTKQGLGAASGLVGGYQQFGFDGTDAGRQRIEQSVYDRLTKNMDRDKGREMEAIQQDMYNKGIAYSDDPNSRYQKELGSINERYDDRAESAMGQAVGMGGSEMLNQYNVQRGTHQQGISDIGSLQGVGSGLLMPNWQPYSAPNYDVNDPSSYVYGAEGLKDKDADRDLTAKGLDQQNAIANKQLELAAKQAGAGGGQPAPPPFP